MRELSIFVDESGSDGLSDHHYLLTVRHARPIREHRGFDRGIRGRPSHQGTSGHTLPCVAAHERQGPVLRTRPKDAQDAARLVPSLLPPHAREVPHLRIRDQKVRLARQARGDDAKGYRELPVQQPRGAAGLRYGQGPTTTTASTPSPSLSTSQSSTRCRRTQYSTDRRNPPSTGFHRRRTTSAPWNSQRSSTRSMRPPRRTRSS